MTRNFDSAPDRSKTNGSEQEPIFLPKERPTLHNSDCFFEYDLLPQKVRDTQQLEHLLREEAEKLREANPGLPQYMRYALHNEQTGECYLRDTSHRPAKLDQELEQHDLGFRRYTLTLVPGARIFELDEGFKQKVDRMSEARDQAAIKAIREDLDRIDTPAAA